MKKLLLVLLGFWLGVIVTGGFILALSIRQPAPAPKPANRSDPTRLEPEKRVLPLLAVFAR